MNWTQFLSMSDAERRQYSAPTKTAAPVKVGNVTVTPVVNGPFNAYALHNADEVAAAQKALSNKNGSPTVATAVLNTELVNRGVGLSTGQPILVNKSANVPRGFETYVNPDTHTPIAIGDSYVAVAKRGSSSPWYETAFRVAGQLVATAINPYFGAVYAGATNANYQEKSGRKIDWGRAAKAGGTQLVVSKILGSDYSTTTKLGLETGVYLADIKTSGATWQQAIKESAWSTAGSRTAGITTAARAVYNDQPWEDVARQYLISAGTSAAMSAALGPGVVDNKSVWFGDIPKWSKNRFNAATQPSTVITNLKSDIGKISRDLSPTNIGASIKQYWVNPEGVTSEGVVKKQWRGQAGYSKSMIAPVGSQLTEWFGDLSNGFKIQSTSHPDLQYYLSRDKILEKVQGLPLGTQGVVDAIDVRGKSVGKFTVIRQKNGETQFIGFVPKKPIGGQ